MNVLQNMLETSILANNEQVKLPIVFTDTESFKQIRRQGNGLLRLGMYSCIVLDVENIVGSGHSLSYILAHELGHLGKKKVTASERVADKRAWKILHRNGFICCGEDKWKK